MSKKKVWSSKYALTAGITEHQAEIKGDSAYPGAPFASFVGFVMGEDAHESREAAAAAADVARKKKIAALEKQIGKLKAMKF